MTVKVFLIIWIAFYGSGVHIETVEFSNSSSCEIAAKKLNKEQMISAMCVSDRID